MKKKFFFFLLIFFFISNCILLFKAYNNKTFPYYEAGYIFRKLDRELNKIFIGKDKIQTEIIETAYSNNISKASKSKKLETALLPLKMQTINIDQYVKFAEKGGDLANAKNIIILLDRLGNIFSYNGDVVFKEKIKVPNNIENFIIDYTGDNIKFTSDSLRSYSIDYDNINKKLYVSYTQYVKDNIIKLKVSSLKYDFDNHTKISDWVDHFETENLFDAANASQGGGGKLKLDGNYLYLTVGYTYQKKIKDKLYFSSNDPKSFTGKIIKINLENDNSRIISLGHRNSQGIVILNNGTILSTEHGPQGGDEVNEIIEGQHYGYPFKIFGTSYGEYKIAGHPKKNIIKNYTDPIYFFSPSIGISAIEQISKFHERWKNDLLIGSLKARTLFRAKYVKKNIISVEPIWIGERIRDILVNNEKIYILTDSSELKIISVDKKQLKSGLRYNNLGAGGNYISLDSNLKKCLQCHSFSGSNPSSGAPSLNKVFNRKIASDNFQNYSKSLSNKFNNGEIWDNDNLFKYLSNPQKFAPGGIKLDLGLDAKEVNNIILLLKKQSLDVNVK